MNKNVFKWMLMATVVLCLTMSITACSDDDEKEKDEQAASDSQKGMSELKEDQLRDLICQWCDVQKDELSGSAWKAQTFEPTIGYLADESTPMERSLAVGTTEEADRYALRTLSTLGIDPQSPDGFTYSDAQVGTISYNHVTGSNTLAIIEMDIKQLPTLRRLCLVRQGNDNASDQPYYRTGDIIKYKNRYYVCASDHKYGEKALFVTFNNQAEKTTGDFGWRGVGDDIVYNTDMASPETIHAWLANIVGSKQKRDDLRGRLVDYGLNEEQINQVVPATEDQTHMLMCAISDPYHMLLNTTAGGSASAASAFTWQVLKECQGDPLEPNFNFTDPNNLQRLLVAPVGMLLTNKVRWRVNFFSSWDQWMPYIFLVKDSEYAQNKSDLDGLECVTTLSKSHFVWQNAGTMYLDEKLVRPAEEDFKSDIKAGTYHVLVLAVYWQHEIANIQGYPTQLLFDFTKDWGTKTDKSSERFRRSSNYWWRRNITSTEITFTDKGKAQSKYEKII